MEIVGNGFLARHLWLIAHRHEGVVALAAGVSAMSATDRAGFAREADLVKNVAERCRAKGDLLVFFSTSTAAVYGADRPYSEDESVGRNPYGVHKLGLENWLRESGVDCLVLRLSHLVGPGQPPHQLLPTLLRLLREGTVRIHRYATRDLIAVGDVVTILDALLTRGMRDETVNVATGTAVSVEDIVDHLERRLDVKADREYQETGAAHWVSTEKLRSLVPEVSELRFGPGYHVRVLDALIDNQRLSG
jgi:nucleoside-diphosphate-sugar epimerase